MRRSLTNSQAHQWGFSPCARTKAAIAVDYTSRVVNWLIDEVLEASIIVAILLAILYDM